MEFQVQAAVLTTDQAEGCRGWGRCLCTPLAEAKGKILHLSLRRGQETWSKTKGNESKNKHLGLYQTFLLVK